MEDHTRHLQPVKPWYSALGTLHFSPNNAPNNRIGPLMSTKKSSSSLSSLKSASLISPSSTSPSIKHVLKRMTRTPTLSRSNSSNVSSKKRGQQHQRQNDEGVRIYLKSPHAIANGQLSGTIVLQSCLMNTFQSILLCLTGTEEVEIPENHESKDIIYRYEFLDVEILSMTVDQIRESSISQDDVVEIPFSVSLSPHISGSFRDSRIGSIDYCLRSEMKYNNSKNSITEIPVSVYSNFTSKLYNPSITKRNIQVWKSASTGSCVAIDLSLSHSVWTMGGPIHVIIAVQNNSAHTVSDLKVELLRKQTTFCVGKENESIPIISTCEKISEKSLANLKWWYPIKPSKQDHLTLAIEAPMDQATVMNQKLIDISFFVRLIISSSERTDIVAELPIILAYPISINPPASLFAMDKYNVEPSLIKDLPRITLCDEPCNLVDTGDNNRHSYLGNETAMSISAAEESEEDSDILRVEIMDGTLRMALSDILEVDTPISDQAMDDLLSEQLGSPTSSFEENVDGNSLTFDIIRSRATGNPLSASTPRSFQSPASVASSLHSIINTDSMQTHNTDENSQVRLLRRSYTTSSSNKLSKMKRNFSTWSTLISRKMSVSKNDKKSDKVISRPKISSPIISNHSISSCCDSPASSLKSTPESTKNRDLIDIIHRNSREFQPQRSIMKFGQIKGPKRFGQQPGSLGDAGLDIRKCFNVATATEAIKSFSAEKVEIPDDIPFYSCSGSSIGSDDDTDELNDEQSPNETLRDNFSLYLKPVPLAEGNFRWKEGFVAPPEKCQIDMSMIDPIEVDEQTRRSLSKNPATTKRVLASSRHLMSIQKSSQQPIQTKNQSIPPCSV